MVKCRDVRRKQIHINACFEFAFFFFLKRERELKIKKKNQRMSVFVCADFLTNEFPCMTKEVESQFSPKLQL